MPSKKAMDFNILIFFNIVDEMIKSTRTGNEGESLATKRPLVDHQMTGLHKRFCHNLNKIKEAKRIQE